jgi:serine/threonine-protein kinase
MLLIDQNLQNASFSKEGGFVLGLLFALNIVQPQELVPNILGLTSTAATALLAAYELTGSISGSVYSSSVPAGLVISQSPISGTTAPAGSDVSYVLSIGTADSRLLVKALTPGAFEGVSYSPGDEFDLP